AMKETISYIMRHTTRSKVSTHGLTAIYSAVIVGDPDLVQHVLEVGGNDNIDTPCEANFTPLAIAIMQSNKPVFELLLKHGANPFKRLEDGSYNYLHVCANQFNLDP